MILWFFMNKQFSIKKYLSFVTPDPSPSPFRPGIGKRVSIFACIALRASSHVSFKMVAQKNV